MQKRRVEILALVALILLAAVKRPTIPSAVVDLRPDLYRVGDFAPQQVETVRDLSVIAVKLLVTWIG